MTESATIDLPGAGPVKKQWIYIGLAGVAAVVGYAYWKRSQQAATAPMEPGIDDYTGGVQTGSSGSTTGGLTWEPADPGDPDDLPPSTNAVWTQRAISYLSQINFDAQVVAAALGKYLARLPLVPAEADIVRTAEGAIGKPPVGTYQIVMVPNPPTGPVTPPPPDAPTAAPEFLPVPLNRDLEEWIRSLNTQYPGLGLTWGKYMALNDLDGANRKYWHVVNGQPQFYKWHPTLGIPALRIR